MSSKLGLLVVAANLALFSCAPKDEKLVQPAGVGVTAQNVSSEDAIKLLFISLDRPVEALHYLKVAVSADYATQKQIVTTDAVGNIKTISAPAGANEKGGPVNDNLQATVQLNADSTIKSVIIQDLLPKKIESKTITPTSSLKSLVKQISITKQEGKDIYDVTITAIEETNSKAGGNGSANTFANFSIAWDGKAESLNNPIVITDVAAIGQNKYNGVSFAAKATAVNLTVSLAECSKLDGTISLVSTKNPGKNKPPNEIYNLTLTDSSIAVANKSVSYQAAACASRPVVDLNKLF